MKKPCFSIAIIFLSFAFISLFGCDNPRKIPKDFDYGSWTGSTYTNDFFGFSITVPENWHIAEKEEIKKIMQEGSEADFVDKKEMKKMNKTAEITTANLFFVSRYTDEEAMEEEAFNPNIGLVVEKLPSIGKKIDRAKYVDLFRQNAAKAVPGSIFKPAQTKMIGGREFTSLIHEINFQGITISSESLICLENNFAVVFNLTSIDEEEKEQLDAIMATLKWK